MSEHEAIVVLVKVIIGGSLAGLIVRDVGHYTDEWDRAVGRAAELVADALIAGATRRDEP